MARHDPSSKPIYITEESSKELQMRTQEVTIDQKVWADQLEPNLTHYRYNWVIVDGMFSDATWSGVYEVPMIWIKDDVGDLEGLSETVLTSIGWHPEFIEGDVCEQGWLKYRVIHSITHCEENRVCASVVTEMISNDLE